MGDRTAARAAETSTIVSSRRLMIVLCTVAVFLYWNALYLYMPTLPTYVESKSDNLALVGVVLSMYGLWQALVRIPVGVASDWVGKRKPFIIGGFALAALGAWVMGTASGVNGLLLGRAITGLAAGTWVPLIVLFSSLFPPQEAVRASALLTLVGSVGRMLATGVTGSLNGLGGYSLAFFLAAAAAVLAMVVMVPSREQTHTPKRPSWQSIYALASRRDVLLPSVLSLIAQYATWGATFGFIPILAAKLGATGMTQSALVSMNVGVGTLGNLVATTIVNRIGARRLVYGSFILLCAGVAGVGLAPSLPFVFVAQLCIGLSQGIVYPVLMGLSIRQVGESQRTTAMGLHQSIYAIGMFAGPAASGVIADLIGIRPMFGVTAAVCLVLGLYATRRLKEREEQ